VVFRIATADLAALDRAEGAGVGYDRDDAFAVTVEGEAGAVAAVTYVATHTDDTLKPFDWYVGLVLAGALENGLDGDHVERLRAVAHIADTNHARQGRRLAMAALGHHGIHDLAALLRGA
jgi:hypothetical protein